MFLDRQRQQSSPCQGSNRWTWRTSCNWPHPGRKEQTLTTSIFDQNMNFKGPEASPRRVGTCEFGTSNLLTFREILTANWWIVLVVFANPRSQDLMSGMWCYYLVEEIPALETCWRHISSFQSKQSCIGDLAAKYIMPCEDCNNPRCCSIQAWVMCIFERILNGKINSSLPRFFAWRLVIDGYRVSPWLSRNVLHNFTKACTGGAYLAPQRLSTAIVTAVQQKDLQLSLIILIATSTGWEQDTLSERFHCVILWNGRPDQQWRALTLLAVREIAPIEVYWCM